MSTPRQTLPLDEVLFLRSLSRQDVKVRAQVLHDAGWSLASIANAFDPPKQRSSVRVWVTAPRAPIPAHFPPAPPAHTESPSSDTSSSSLHSSLIAAGENSAFDPLAPPPPAAAAQVVKKRRTGRRVYDPRAPRLSPSDRTKISTLAPLARRYRARMTQTSASARANRELTALCVKLYLSGTSVRELSLAAGVTYRAMARRIGR